MPGPIQPHNYVPKPLTQFENTGHPGLWYKSVTVSSATTDFTGSNFGAGGLITSGAVAGTVTLSNGGSIDLSHLTAGELYQFSISQVVESGGATVYVLYQAAGEGGRV